jgi:tetratricopeptide (TPR) repeat protein
MAVDMSAEDHASRHCTFARSDAPMIVARLGSVRIGVACVMFLITILGVADGVSGQPLTAAQKAFHQGYAYHTGEGQEANLDLARRYYLQAVKHDPTLFPALSNLALIYYGAKNYKKAKYYYSEAIKAARGSDDITGHQEAKVSSELGACYFQEGKLLEAEKWFRAAIAHDSGLVEAHYNLINLLLKQDHRDEARQAMAIAERVAPSTRYGLFEGRLRGKQSWDEWNPTWVKVIAGAALLAVLVLPLLRWLKNR